VGPDDPQPRTVAAARAATTTRGQPRWVIAPCLAYWDAASNSVPPLPTPHTNATTPTVEFAAALYLASNGAHFVYYVGTDGHLHVDHWTGSSWQDDDLGATVQGGTSPSGYLGSNGAHFVYYVGSDGHLHADHWTGITWQNDDLGPSVQGGTSPSAYGD